MKGRIAPLCGVVFVLLAVAAFAIGGESPDADASARKAVKFYTEHDSDQILSAALLTWATVLFLFFAGNLRAVLRRAEGDEGFLSAVGFGGAVALTIGAAIFSGIAFTLGDVADKLDPAAVQALSALNSDLFFPLALGTSVFLIASGLTIARTGALPRWLGWIAVLLGLVGLSPLGFFAFLGFLVWTLVTGVVMALRAGRAESSAAGAS